MPDVEEALDRLRDDVSGTRLAAAAALRRDADRRGRRRTTRVAIPSLVALAAVAVVVTAQLSPGAEPDLPAVVVPAPSDPAVDGPWLPAPWRLDSVERTSLPPVSAAGDQFCGITAADRALPVTRQTMSDGTSTVRVYAVSTPTFQRAADVFKQVYAACVASGPVASEAGPALYWETATGTPAAALWDHATIYLFASGPTATGTAPADLRAVVAALDATVGHPCDASTAGTSCPPTGG